MSIPYISDIKWFDVQVAQRPHFFSAVERGFSLLDLLVVLAILGFVAAIAGQTSLGMARRGGATSLALELAAGLRSARAGALLQNQYQDVSLDLAERRYRLAGNQTWTPFPTGLSVTVTGAAELTTPDNDILSIRFWPDGSASGGGISIKGAGPDFHLSVDWATGRTQVTKGAQR